MPAHRSPQRPPPPRHPLRQPTPHHRLRRGFCRRRCCWCCGCCRSWRERRLAGWLPVARKFLGSCGAAGVFRGKGGIEMASSLGCIRLWHGLVFGMVSSLRWVRFRDGFVSWNCSGLGIVSFFWNGFILGTVSSLQWIRLVKYIFGYSEHTTGLCGRRLQKKTRACVGQQVKRGRRGGKSQLPAVKRITWHDLRRTFHKRENLVQSLDTEGVRRRGDPTLQHKEFASDNF